MKSHRNYNADNIFKKGELRQLKKTRDWFLIFSMLWTAFTIFMVWDGKTSDIKICAAYLVVFGGWVFTYRLNQTMRLIKKYCKSLYIRPSLEEQDKEVHNVK